ncbi:MAG: GNAT family N-acetyltransferase [Candidatus Woesearchaeota archaeon]
MKIRSASKEDFEEYFKLESEFTEHNNRTASIEDFKYRLIKSKIKKNFIRKLGQKKKLFLVLEDDDGLQGYLFGEVEKLSRFGYKYNVDNIGYLENCFIRKNHRGKGYFSIMTDKFFKWLKSKKIKYCALHVSVTNEPAIKAYKKYDFKQEEYKMVCMLQALS